MTRNKNTSTTSRKALVYALVRELRKTQVRRNREAVEALVKAATQDIEAGNVEDDQFAGGATSAYRQQQFRDEAEARHFGLSARTIKQWRQ